MLEFAELRRALIGVEDKDTVLVRQFESFYHLGPARFLIVALGSLFFIELRGFFHRVGGGVARSVIGAGVVRLPSFGGVPVDQAVGQFFPLAATLHGHVAHADARYLILANNLVASVFQDEAMIVREPRRIRRDDFAVLPIAFLAALLAGRNCRDRRH